MNKNKCPWLGFKPYNEEDAAFFNGRKKATMDLLNIIKNKTITVCYAESGIGKSSLINAGVMPILRELNFLPISIRFDFEEFKEKESDDVTGLLCNQLLAAFHDAVNKFEKKNEPYKLIWDIPEQSQGATLYDLWKVLRNIPKVSVPFNGFEYHNVYKPFLIFDQFEQMLYDSNSQLVIESFFNLLKSLVLNDTFGKDYQELKEQGLVKDDEDSFKVLVSIRQEYIGVLDYWCMARVPMPSLHDNRYSLQPLTEEEAKEVILPEGYDIFEDATNKIIEIAKENDTVSSILLSVICRSLWEKAPLIRIKESEQKAKVSEDEVDNKKETIIEDYYRERIKKVLETKVKENENDEPKQLLTEEIIIQLEDELVGDDGKRLLLAVRDNKLQNIVFTEQIKILLENNGIIRSDKIGETTFVELIHDRVACAVVKRKNERRNQKNKEERRKENYKRFIARQNPLTLGGRQIWDNKTFTFSVDNSRRNSLQNSSSKQNASKQNVTSSKSQYLYGSLQLATNDDWAVEQHFFDKLFSQTKDDGQIILDLKTNYSKDGVSIFDIFTELIEEKKLRKVKEIRFFSSDYKPFYTADGFCGMICNYNQETGNEIFREYLCDGYTSIGISIIKFNEYNKYGFPVIAMYYDKNGQCRHIDGNYGVKLEYDKYGNETCRWFLDKKGKIAPIYNGVCGLVSVYDNQDRITTQYFVNEKIERIFDIYGIHGVMYNYHDAPNDSLVSETIYINTEGQPCITPQGYSTEKLQYDNNGRIIRQLYYDHEGKEVEKHDGTYNYSLLEIEYKESNFDRPDTAIMFNLSGDVIKEAHYKYNRKGSIEECSYFERKKTQHGYKVRKGRSNDNNVHKIKYEHDNHGVMVCQIYVDENDKSMNDSNGNSKLELLYDESGNLSERRFYSIENDEKEPIVRIKHEYTEIDNRVCKITQQEYKIITVNKTVGKILGIFSKKKEEKVAVIKEQPTTISGFINNRFEFIRLYVDEHDNDFIPNRSLTVRQKFDVDGNVVEQLLYDKNDTSPICDNDGAYGWRTENDKLSGETRIILLGENKEIANNKYGYAIKVYKGELYEGVTYTATYYYDAENRKTLNKQGGYHKILERQIFDGDDLYKHILYFDCDGSPCNCVDGYQEQKFNEEVLSDTEIKRTVWFLDADGKPMINQKRGFHKRVQIFSTEKNMETCRCFYDEHDDLINVSEGFAKQTCKPYDSLGTLFHYPFADHLVIRFYDKNDNKVDVDYEIGGKLVHGYKFIVSLDYSVIWKAQDSKGKTLYLDKSLLWKYINLVWIPIAVILFVLIYPIYSMGKWVINKFRRQEETVTVETATIIRVAQIFDEIPNGNEAKPAPIKPFDVEEGCWIVRWNDWSYKNTQDIATDFETEFNISPERKLITFYNPIEKEFLDVDITSPNLGLRIQDAQVPIEEVREMLSLQTQSRDLN